MKRLELDFIRTRRPAGWAAWTLLAVALAFAADLGYAYFTLRDAVARKEARLAALGETPRAEAMLKVTNRLVKEEELAAARDTIRRLSIPWDNLFQALESSLGDKVALLAVEPDVANSTIMLSGEAKDYLAALSYVANLKQQSQLSEVHLVKHELRQNDPQRPVAFTVSASWGAQR